MIGVRRTITAHGRVVTLTCCSNSQIVSLYIHFQTAQFDLLNQFLRELVTQTDIIQTEEIVLGQETGRSHVGVTIAVTVGEARYIGVAVFLCPCVAHVFVPVVTTNHAVAHQSGIGVIVAVTAETDRKSVV